MSEWQPIETAPKDGTRILVWDSHMEEWTIVQWCIAEPGRYGDTEKCWATDSTGPGYQSEIENPLHWMPLPAPPNTGTKGR